VPGVVLGAVLLALFPEVLRHTVQPVQTMLFGKVIVEAEVLRMMLYGLAMVVIMLYRPKGLWPAPEHGVNPSSRGRHRGLRATSCCASRRQQALRRTAALSDVGIRSSAARSTADRPNGAGKTTFFNVITGLYAPDSGTFELDGKPYSPHEVHRVAAAGIARTFQNIRLFPDMTALENVMVGRHVRTKATALGAILRTRATVREESAIKQRSLELLGTSASASTPTTRRARSHGDQRRLNRARSRPTRSCLRSTSRPPG
jgi:predicted ABC-type transport system involved in lysophospholipase L1 biosynthesis ATPase subunit